jgi:hypothetical protein
MNSCLRLFLLLSDLLPQLAASSFGASSVVNLLITYIHKLTSKKNRKYTLDLCIDFIGTLCWIVKGTVADAKTGEPLAGANVSAGDFFQSGNR